MIRLRKDTYVADAELSLKEHIERKLGETSDPDELEKLRNAGVGTTGRYAALAVCEDSRNIIITIKSFITISGKSLDEIKKLANPTSKKS